MGSTSEDKDWASRYLLDPLTAPEPSQLTGPGTHFGSTLDKKLTPTPPASTRSSQSKLSSRNPFRGTQPLIDVTQKPQGGQGLNDKPLPRGPPRQRHGSLSQRYPGDVSHRPLDVIRKQNKLASQAPHLKKKHLPQADLIDSLDASMDQLYHHEGPYDATLLARNTSKYQSPIDAVRASNAEALKATPQENIQDALSRHVPLQGVGIVPAGGRLASGQVMDYTEGDDLMRDSDAPGGAYKRWDGVKYLPEDYKGKGEPSFSADAARDKRRGHRRIASEDNFVYEMQPTPRARPSSRQRSISGVGPEQEGSPSDAARYPEFGRNGRPSSSMGRKFGDGIKRRFGSLRKNKKPT
ncbi:hypothetical protein VC83_06405 [Pseudogymnoascus destructans]|uniref:Protein pal1 n=2 Tax=Pseudogymnoascus destructans TaxID=655981 RepID=L8GBI2_PSED2|nr:uncharacterized protein VC83_06405 [Pseudogymnoascus destructans]ELR10003.1 hypothetical protein GMDG_00761 [Pseudogymnoascus destructans 20631-21]OAF58393.1 hypothetical protein VC83_06405 [Pseudogymnoascus destructans]